MNKTLLNSSETAALRNKAGVSQVRRSLKIRAFFAVITVFMAIMLMQAWVFAEDSAHYFVTAPHSNGGVQGGSAAISWETSFIPTRVYIEEYSRVYNEYRILKTIQSELAHSMSYKVPTGNVYRVSAYYGDGYFCRDTVSVGIVVPSFDIQPLTKVVNDAGSGTVDWELNFTPKKQYLIQDNEQIKNIGADVFSLDVDVSETYYKIRAYYDDNNYIESNAFNIISTPMFIKQPNNGAGDSTDGAYITWKPNFSPRKVEILVNDVVRETITAPTWNSTFVAAYIKPTSTRENPVYDHKLRVYYNTSQYIESDPFYVVYMYRVKYDSNGGSGEMSDTTGWEINLRECKFDPPEDKQFSCWQIDGIDHAVGEHLVLTKDITAYAIWKDKEYTVTFNVGGYPNTPEPQTVEKNKTAVEPTLPDDWNGKTVTGWYTDSSFTSKFSFDTPITADTQLFAKWEDIISDFDLENGDNTITKTVYYGDVVTVVADMTQYYPVNWDVWYLASDGTTKTWQSYGDDENWLTLDPSEEPGSYILQPNGWVMIRADGTDYNDNQAASDYIVLNIVYKQGDIDGNGKIEKKDAAMLLKHISNAQKITDTAILARADMDYNGSIDMLDVIKILQIAEESSN